MWESQFCLKYLLSERLLCRNWETVCVVPTRNSQILVQSNDFISLLLWKKWFFFKAGFRDEEGKIGLQKRRQKDYNPDALVPQLMFLKGSVIYLLIYSPLVRVSWVLQEPLDILFAFSEFHYRLPFLYPFRIYCWKCGIFFVLNLWNHLSSEKFLAPLLQVLIASPLWHEAGLLWLAKQYHWKRQSRALWKGIPPNSVSDHSRSVNLFQWQK